MSFSETRSPLFRDMLWIGISPYRSASFCGSGTLPPWGRKTGVASASNPECHRQIDSRPALPDALAQIGRQDFAVGRQHDRRQVRIDCTQAVGGRGIEEATRVHHITGDGSLVYFGGPVSGAASIDHGTIADPIGGDHDGAGDFDFLL